MFGIIISVIVLITMGYLILKNYKPQVVLAAAGIFLMMCGVWLGFGGVLDPACACCPTALPDWGCRLWQWAVMPAIWSA